MYFCRGFNNFLKVGQITSKTSSSEILLNAVTEFRSENGKGKESFSLCFVKNLVRDSESFTSTAKQLGKVMNSI